MNLHYEITEKRELSFGKSSGITSFAKARYSNNKYTHTHIVVNKDHIILDVVFF